MESKRKISQNKIVAKRGKNINWEMNQELIENAITEMINEMPKNSRKLPSLNKVAERIGLSYDTVKRHAKELDIKELIDSKKVYLPKIINNIIAMTAKSPASQKLALQMFGVLGEDNQQNVQLNIQVNLPERLEDE